MAFLTLQCNKIGWRLAGVSLALALLSTACTIPGPVAPSTLPLSGKYVELGPHEEITECGYTVMGIRFGNPKPVYDAIQAMIKARGGDALIRVDSGSYYYNFLLFAADCYDIRGTVVKSSQ
jgi:hypothetical protein